MLGKIFGILCILACCFALFSGNAEAVGNAVTDGATGAVQILLTLGGMMCLWCGMMRVLCEAGLIRKLARLLRPVLRVFFPDAARTNEGLEEICANISANLLGIGNAATPLALQAMKKLQQHNPRPDSASAEQITLAVLNTASFSLIPANIIALRRAAGSSHPFAILLPVWITSLLCGALALLLTTLSRLPKKSRRSGRRNKGDHDDDR